MKTYKDVYKLPLTVCEDTYRVYDKNYKNFVFQFLFPHRESQILLLNVINGDQLFQKPDLSFRHEDGYIIDSNGRKIILIRGWGNLTGIGAMNLPPEEAANIQDTFADFIVEQLNKR